MSLDRLPSAKQGKEREQESGFPLALDPQLSITFWRNVGAFFVLL